MGFSDGRPCTLFFRERAVSPVVGRLPFRERPPNNRPAADREPTPSPPGEVLKTVLLNLVDNPIKALSGGNYIGILAWALMLGFALRHASAATRSVVADMADAVSDIVGWVIRFAPLGIFGLISAILAAIGFEALKDYAVDRKSVV